MIKTEQMESFPVGGWPFKYDSYHMGTRMGQNVMVMYENFPGDRCKYLILVNMETGERIKVCFSQAAITSFQGEFRFLSNFHPAEVEFDLVKYPTVENAFQAAKCADKKDRAQFVGVTPGQAKRLGRKVKVRADWDQIRADVMGMLVSRKFEIPELREKLLATGGEELIEGNDWGDTFWGVCKGKGENRLGQILMMVRMVCRSHESPV